MKTALRVLLSLALVLLAYHPASAVVFTLSNWNTSELNTAGDDVTVDVTTNATTTTLKVQWVSGNGSTPPSGIGIDQFFYDAAANVSTFPTSTTVKGWSQDSKGCGKGCTSFGPWTADGFTGTFARAVSEPGGTGGIGSALVFVLPGVLTTLDSASDFAAHVRYGSDCSGFVSGRTATATSNTNCAVPVPEPSSLLLVGAGLVGLGYVGRKRWFRG